MKRMFLAVLLLGLLTACKPQATPTLTPDAVATQVAVLQSAASTLTAQAPTTAPPATAVRVETAPADVPTATAVVVPSATLPAPTATPTRPAPTRTPPPTQAPTLPPPTDGPSLGDYAVVGVYGDDVLNVRMSPGVSQPIVGTIPYYGRNVQLFAAEQQVGGAPWVRGRYGPLAGWVNRSYLARQAGLPVPDGLAASAAQAVLALRDRNMAALAALAHPVKGVTFSPYTFVRPLQGAPGEADLAFSPAQIAGLWSDPAVYHWGVYDGSGMPIDATFQAYYAEFVYDVDFAQPEYVSFALSLGQGNTTNNIREAYPQGVLVEYYFSGFDPQYAGMDWRSLRLVLEQQDGTWYLVGIVHDEWTI